MKHLSLKFIFILSFILCSIIGCERDDLCSDVPITPLLIITFEDDNNTGVRMNVPSLQITSIKNNQTIFSQPPTTDSINIPLDINANSTRYIFTRNSGDLNPENTRSDTITFSYQRENIYVNRACGFRTIFSELDSQRETDNWIINSSIDNPNVNDQINAHIRLSF